MKFLPACLLAAMVFRGTGQGIEFNSHRNKTVAFSGGTFPDTSFESVTYVGSELLDSLFGGSSRWVPGSQQLRMRDRAGRQWVFTVDNPFIAFNGEVFNLTYPARRGIDNLYLPLHPLLRMLRARFGIDLPLQRSAIPSGEHPPKSNNGSITALELEKRTNGTLLRVHVTGDLKWEGLSAPPHYLLRLTGGRLAASCPARLKGKGLVKNVAAVQEKDLVQITLQLRGRYDTVEVLRDSSLPGFLVTVRRAPPESKKSPATPVAVTPPTGTIIIDPGHGGHDRGAVVRGVEEAVITLAVAKELKKFLIDLGYKVMLTREDDEYKTLAERPRFASEQGGDVFVSLHCNSLPGASDQGRNITGYTVYILREGESEEDKALARRENQAIEEKSGKAGKNEIAPVDWILLEHQLNLYSKQSESLAESIVRGFDGFGIPKYSTGARQAGFFVLVGAYMPAVLFEMGFLTHPKDRRILASKSGQREIARRMALSIDKFRKQASR